MSLACSRLTRSIPHAGGSPLGCRLGAVVASQTRMAPQYSEQRLEQLKAFVGDGTPTAPLTGPVLEILGDIATTGLMCYPWTLVRSALVAKLDQTINTYVTGFGDCTKEAVEARRAIIHNGLGIFAHALSLGACDSLSLYGAVFTNASLGLTHALLKLTSASAPFTLQRLTEIALQLPGSSYATTQKLLNAIEKLTRVSTMEPSLSKEEYGEQVAILIAAEEEEMGEDEPSTPMEVDQGSPEHSAEEIACIDETMEDVEPNN